MNTELIKLYANIAVVSCVSYFFMTYSSTFRIIGAIVVARNIVTSCNLDLAQAVKNYNSVEKKREEIVENAINKNQA